jgi:hypothetical protein
VPPSSRNAVDVDAHCFAERAVDDGALLCEIDDDDDLRAGLEPLDDLCLTSL